MKIYFIYSTFKNAKSAKLLSSKLVKNKLAACTNIIPAITAFPISDTHKAFQKWVIDHTK